MTNNEGEEKESQSESEVTSQQATEESNRILEVARRRNAVLRLVGGLAINKHCTEHDFCDRSHGDLDFVALSSQYENIVEVMKEAGYNEVTSMTFSTGGSRLLFERPGMVDHIDLFMDRIDIEHVIDLRNRLEIDEDTVSISDLLLLKLTITR
ncbi:MAG: hypothetical protein ACW98J_06545, partial [Candidatus Thorarchaeota archaeon]